MTRLTVHVAIACVQVFRFGGELLVELRTITYAMVSAKIEKKIASDVFQHLQALALRFHLERKTGSVLRSCTRGASSFSEVARSILFQFIPILIQIAIVVIYLVRLGFCCIAISLLLFVSLLCAFSILFHFHFLDFFSSSLPSTIGCSPL